MTELTEKQIRQTLYRKYNLPKLLRTARSRVDRLEAEARLMGLHALLTDPVELNQAWEREVELARLKGGEV